MATLETDIAGGVSFALTAEQRELRGLAREFAEIRPKAAEYDEHQPTPPTSSPRRTRSAS